MFLTLMLACYSNNALKVQNTAPTVNIYSHEEGMELTVGSMEVFVANIVDLNDSLDSLSIEWYYGDTQICTDAYIDANDDTFCELEILPSATKVQVIVRDSSNAVGDDMLNFELFQNTAPEAPLIEISPEEPSTIDDVTAMAVANDIDGDSLQYSYVWAMVEEPDTIISSTNQLSAAETTKGQVWQVTATPSDGYEQGPSSTISFTIKNAPPVIDEVVITPDAGIYNNSTLTCAATATDPDQAEDLSYITLEWFNNGTSLGQEAELVLDSASIAPDDTIICQATAADVDGESSTSQASVLVENREFVLYESSLSPLSPRVDDVLELYVDVMDPDGQELDIQYDWLVNASAVSSGSETLSGVFVRGDVVEGQITITDGEFSTTLPHTTTIGNSSPTSPTVTTTPSAPLEGQDALICELDTPSADADGDAITYTVSWTKNGSPYSGTTQTTYITDDTIPASATSLNDVWKCQISASDGYDLALSPEETFTTVNGYCSYYVSQTCTTSSTTWQYGRNAYCGINNSCVWCCMQDYVDPDCEGYCSTANPAEDPCPNWHEDYYNECDYPTTTVTEYECGYNTTGLCN